jgi:transcriptional regulator GlxA family with amidase domain
MLALASAVDPLRLANRMIGRELYQWQFVSDDGQEVTCSNGARIGVDGGLVDLNRDATIVVASGIDAAAAATRPVLTWLRKQSRLGARIGAICTGTIVLARAGLLDGKRCTIHWENQAAFREEYLDIELTNRLYEIDGDVFTCAGGAAATDMILSLMARDIDPEVVGLVADQAIHTPIRGEQDEQRLSVPARIGVRHPKLISIIQTMEQSLEEPISPSILAENAQMSTRQLERLFRRYLNRSPKRYYMELRLQKARNLLLQTEMSVINVALACGFTSPSHFSKCYRGHFNRTPYRERGSPNAPAEDLT